MTHLAFGARVRELRVSSDLSVKELAQRTGYTVESVERIEAGEITVNQTVALRFSTALGGSEPLASWLLYGRERWRWVDADKREVA